MINQRYITWEMEITTTDWKIMSCNSKGNISAATKCIFIQFTSWHMQWLCRKGKRQSNIQNPNHLPTQQPYHTRYYMNIFAVTHRFYLYKRYTNFISYKWLIAYTNVFFFALIARNIVDVVKYIAYISNTMWYLWSLKGLVDIDDG